MVAFFFFFFFRPSWTGLLAAMGSGASLGFLHTEKKCEAKQYKAEISVKIPTKGPPKSLKKYGITTCRRIWVKQNMP